MLEGRDLLFFGGDWNDFANGFQQIAEVFLRYNRVLWVGSVSIRYPRFRMYDLRRITGRIGNILSSGHRPSKGESLSGNIHPFVLPLYDVPAVQKMNDSLLRHTLRKRMNQLGFRDVIAFPSTPMVADIIGTLGETSSHYFCMDDYTAYDGVYRRAGRLEKKILEKVDSCFALSEPLLQTRKARSGENHYLPMGVDVELFGKPAGSLPDELKPVRKPIAGFFGQIGSYVDIDLIVRCAKTYPDVSFVIIGRPHTDLSPLRQAKNIVFLGEKPYRRIPVYAQGFDIALNPRVPNKLSLSMNPVKILEYLSLGLPVVSTDLPAVRTFKDYIYIAETQEQFIELIGTALRDTDPEKKKSRQALAMQYSWAAIAERVSEIINRIDAAKRSGLSADVHQPHADV